MAALSLSINAIKPLNRWDHDSIRPGPVGSIGGVNPVPRLKSTFPGDFRWDEEFHGENEPRHGSNVTDGSFTNYNTGGGPSRVIDSNWGGRRRFETSHGWRYQDIRVPDRRIEPVLGQLPKYSWYNKIATVNNARNTGKLFSIPAGGIMGGANGVTRGGMYPRVTDVVGGDAGPGVSTADVNDSVGQSINRRDREQTEADQNRKLTAGRMSSRR